MYSRGIKLSPPVRAILVSTHFTSPAAQYTKPSGTPTKALPSRSRRTRNISPPPGISPFFTSGCAGKYCECGPAFGLPDEWRCRDDPDPPLRNQEGDALAESCADDGYRGAPWGAPWCFPFDCGRPCSPGAVPSPALAPASSLDDLLVGGAGDGLPVLGVAGFEEAGLHGPQGPGHGLKRPQPCGDDVSSRRGRG